MNIGLCATSTFIVRCDRGLLSTNKGTAPDQGGSRSVGGGGGHPDSIWSVWGWDLPNILPLDLNLILNC
jgi:hypothetical protein